MRTRPCSDCARLREENKRLRDKLKKAQDSLERVGKALTVALEGCVKLSRRRRGPGKNASPVHRQIIALHFGEDGKRGHCNPVRLKDCCTANERHDYPILGGATPGY